MGEVIPIRREPTPLELAIQILAPLRIMVESIKADDTNSSLLRDVVAERLAEAHDIVLDYVLTSEERK